MHHKFIIISLSSPSLLHFCFIGPSILVLMVDLFIVVDRSLQHHHRSEKRWESKKEIEEEREKRDDSPYVEGVSLIPRSLILKVSWVEGVSISGNFIFVECPIFLVSNHWFFFFFFLIKLVTIVLKERQQGNYLFVEVDLSLIFLGLHSSCSRFVWIEKEVNTTFWSCFSYVFIFIFVLGEERHKMAAKINHHF